MWEKERFSTSYLLTSRLTLLWVCTQAHLAHTKKKKSNKCSEILRKFTLSRFINRHFYLCLPKVSLPVLYAGRPGVCVCIYMFVCVVYVCLLVCMFVSMCVPMDTHVYIRQPKVNVGWLPWLLSSSLSQSTPKNPQFLPPNCRWPPHLSDFYVDSRDPNTSPQTSTVLFPLSSSPACGSDFHPIRLMDCEGVFLLTQLWGCVLQT